MLITKEQMEYMHSLEDSDTEDNFDNYTKRLSRSEEALINAKKTQRNDEDVALSYLQGYPAQKAIYESMSKKTAEELHTEAISTVKGIADVTPIIGEIKAAYELPNDLSYAFELVESGYGEGDLKKMGLGGAFAMLSAMGIVPGVRYGAKAGKEAIKSQLQKRRIDLDEDIVHEMEKGLAKAQGYDVKDYELSSYGAIVEELALIGKSNNGEILEAQIVNKLKSSMGEAPNEEVVKQFKTYLEGNAGFKIEPLVKASIKAPEGLDIKAAKEVATTGELTNAMQQLAKTQDNEITNNQISEILNKGKPNWTSVDLEDSFSDLSIKNIKVVDSLKPSSQYGSTKGFENIDAKTPYQVKTKYLDKSKGIENIDEITKILNDQDKGITSPSAIKALASKQNNEVSKQQLFHILEHYKDAPLDDADYKATMKYFQNTEGVKIVDDAPPINGKVIQKKSDTSNVIGGTFAKADVDMTPDQKAILDRIRKSQETTRNLSDTYGQELNFNHFEIKIAGKLYNIKNKADQIEIAKMLPKSIRRTVIQEMNRPMPKVFHGSSGISQPYGRGTAYADMTRADVLEKEGFMPFTDFEEGVELGIGGSKGASGFHAELGKKMLSTSRDPLVSIKRAFGDLVPANVVSAPFPRSKVRGMTREEYTASKDKSQYSRDDTAAGLPRTRHKESEIAFSTPEELENVRLLSRKTDKIDESVGREELKNLGKMSLEDRVIIGQKFANNVRNKTKNFYTRMNTDVEAYLDASGKVAFGKSSHPPVLRKAYQDLRNLMKDLQSLGQFTEQYGARGTYDSLLQTIFSESDRTVAKLGKLLPEGERKENVQMLASVFERMKDKQYLTDTGKSNLRGVSDKKLKEMMKGDYKISPDKMQVFDTNYEDLKRMVFLLTDKFNRGGLMARR